MSLSVATLISNAGGLKYCLFRWTACATPQQLSTMTSILWEEDKDAPPISVSLHPSPILMFSEPPTGCKWHRAKATATAPPLPLIDTSGRIILLKSHTETYGRCLKAHRTGPSPVSRYFRTQNKTKTPNSSRNSKDTRSCCCADKFWVCHHARLRVLRKAAKQCCSTWNPGFMDQTSLDDRPCVFLSGISFRTCLPPFNYHYRDGSWPNT